jgi:hypothetical protein
MMNKEAITKAIETLQHVRVRPMMFMGAVTAEYAMVFLYGFWAACRAFGCLRELEVDFMREAANQRGWEYTALGSLPDMRKKGLTQEQMVDELLLIDITVLQMMADRDG